MKITSTLAILSISIPIASATMSGTASKTTISNAMKRTHLQNSPLIREESASFDETRSESIREAIDSFDQTLSFDETLSLLSNQSFESLTEVRGGGDDALMQRLKVGFYFGLWYALNVFYNIINKKVLNIIPAPVTVGTIQFGIGALYASLLWLTRIRATPKLTSKGRAICGKVGLYHSSGQLLSMVSLGAGPVSFTHIVKALEPFFSAVVSAVVFKKVMKPQVYASLIPVVGGVGYACLKERHFSWLAFSTAMSSNLAFALRAVVSKSGMNTYIGENITSVNLFACVTIAAFFLSIPVAFAIENTSILALWDQATTGVDAVTTAEDLVKQVLLSGLFHYLNNEVMYLALGNVHPVTLAVGNTMKRVFIMVASVLVFRNPVSVQAGIGSAVGISGVLLYSLTKQYYEKKEAEEAEEAAEAAAKTKGGRRRRGKN